MHSILARATCPTLLAVTLAGCSYQGSEIWRRDVCDSIIDDVERARCLDDATRSESEYRHDVDEALER